MLKRIALLAFILSIFAAQYGCAALAGGAVGAAIGHEAAEREHEDDDD
jgi:hypothetical protein